MVATPDWRYVLSMIRLRWCGIGVALAALACDPAPSPPTFVPVATVQQVMASILEPAADTYWDAVGSVDDSSGTHSHSPGTPEAWDAVRNAAYTMTESGNLLMMAPRARDQGEWMALSRAMIAAGQHAIKAAEARDTVAVFNAGAAVYESCTNCHARYVTAPGAAAAPR